MRLLVTAGYSKSKAAIALCELIVRSGHEVGGIVVVTPYSVKRLRQLLLQRGKEGVTRAIKKMLSTPADDGRDYMGEFLDQQGIHDRSIGAWAKRHDVPCLVVPDINSSTAVNFVAGQNIDALVYAGGGILRRDIITAANRTVINPHCGPLPEVRGMNAIEWAFLLDYALEITVHFIDEGIDTGEIIARAPVVSRDDLAAGSIGLEELRTRAVTTGLLTIARLLQQCDGIDSFPSSKNIGAVAGRQCFVMAPVLQELVAHRLGSGKN